MAVSHFDKAHEKKHGCKVLKVIDSEDEGRGWEANEKSSLLTSNNLSIRLKKTCKTSNFVNELWTDQYSQRNHNSEAFKSVS